MFSGYGNRGYYVLVLTVLLSFCCLCLYGQGSEEKSREGDLTRLEQLIQKQRQGEVLTEEEEAFLRRARGQRQKPSRRQPRETTGLVPLVEMCDAEYKGQSGGLYGNGRNRPPTSHLAAVEKALAQITPLDSNGEPSKAGKIGLISHGMSNTTQEFSAFKEMADGDANKSPDVVIVDCAQGGMAADVWANPEKAGGRDRRSPWSVMDERIEKAGLAPAQVQVVWMKHAIASPQRRGPFPAHARAMQGDLVIVIGKLKGRFVNLRIAYLSSRIYAGYATTGLNPEPYAYESAFTVRWLIEDQIKGRAELNYDPSRGEAKSPVLLWGPYLWADGLNPRKSDGLIWEQKDLSERDGTHPSDSGRRKVGKMLLDFFETEPLARTWFLKNGS